MFAHELFPPGLRTGGDVAQPEECLENFVGDDGKMAAVVAVCCRAVSHMILTHARARVASQNFCLAVGAAQGILNSYRIHTEAKMLATQRTQSVSDFRQKAAETLERLNKTGEAEILTVNGEARAVLVSPAKYDAIMRNRELDQIANDVRISEKQIANGEYSEAGEFFASLRAELLARKRKAGKRK